MNIDPQTRLCVLLGDPVDHSGSPAMHNAAFRASGLNACYLAFQVANDRLYPAIQGLAALGVVGANVTVPHKEAALSMADEASPRAQRIGAANVLTFREGRILADNTDGAGFIASLEEADVQVAGKTILVIGAGGAARAVIDACLEVGAARLLLANRSLDRARRIVDEYRHHYNPGRLDILPLAELSNALAESNIIINATSLGLRPGDPSPVPDWRPAPPGSVAVDIVYSSQPTAFLDGARRSGLKTVDGTGMLVWQAALSWQSWFGRTGPHRIMAQALEDWLRRR